jgi:hypothetical protein
MKKNTLIAALTLAWTVGAFGQGQIVFLTRIGTAGDPTAVLAPIYGVNPIRAGTQLRGNATTNAVSAGTVDYTGYPYLQGTGFTAALFGGLAPITDETSPNLALVATTVFRTGTLAGHVIQGTGPGGIAPRVPGVPGGSDDRATFQLRAWDNRFGTITTWADVMANPSIPQGSSALFTVPFPLGEGATLPPNLVGLTSFNLVVPEPGVIALGVLGLGALLLRRRN